jgi:toxin-antitoxin system PIN domain toxin
VIAIDTNVLVYAHRRDSAWHQPAVAALTRIAENRSGWALPWPCVHEFLAIVTHPRIYLPPSSQAQAIDQVEAWLESPSVVMLGEGDGHWETLRRTLTASQVLGPQVHDARIAALCLQHGVDELWTADRDFSRFAELRTRNPLIA